MVLNIQPSPVLACCELHHPSLHGYTDDSAPDLPGHFLCLETIEPGSLAAADAPPYPPAATQHPRVRAYRALARNRRLFGPQIVHLHELSGGEQVAVIRTGGLRRLQSRIRGRINLG